MEDTKFIFNMKDAYKHSWWSKFLTHCLDLAEKNGWSPETVINYQLRPYKGRWIAPKTYHPYLRFDREADFTMFVLRWA